MVSMEIGGQILPVLVEINFLKDGNLAVLMITISRHCYEKVDWLVLRLFWLWCC